MPPPPHQPGVRERRASVAQALPAAPASRVELQKHQVRHRDDRGGANVCILIIALASGAADCRGPATHLPLRLPQRPPRHRAFQLPPHPASPSPSTSPPHAVPALHPSPSRPRALHRPGLLFISVNRPLSSFPPHGHARASTPGQPQPTTSPSLGLGVVGLGLGLARSGPARASWSGCTTVSSGLWGGLDCVVLQAA